LAESLKTSGTFKVRTTDETAPSTPTNLTITSEGSSEDEGNYINLQWGGSTDNVGITGYEVYLNGASSTAVFGTTTIAKLTYLSEDTPYTIEVQAVDAAGNKSGKASISYIIDTKKENIPNAIQSERISTLQIFPNPVTNGQLVIVNGELKAGEKIAIYTTDGTQVKVAEVSSGEQTIVDVAGLNSGIYVVRAGKQTVKVLIINQ
jgi:hypothetical protein